MMEYSALILDVIVCTLLGITAIGTTVLLINDWMDDDLPENWQLAIVMLIVIPIIIICAVAT